MLAFVMPVLVLLAFSKDTRIALYVAPSGPAVMLVAYFAWRSQHLHAAPQLALEGTCLHAPGANPGNRADDLSAPQRIGNRELRRRTECGLA